MKAALNGVGWLPRLLVVGFVAVVMAGWFFLWTQANGPLPGFLQADDYRVSFYSDDVKNLHEAGEVSVAGVKVGQVVEQTIEDDATRVTVELSRDVVPLHEGVRVRIGVKELVGSSYVDIVDGAGAPIADGTTLPDSAVIPAVDIDELIETFDKETREGLRGTFRSLGAATENSAEDISKLMSGLGKLGREGHTALDAIATQSDDLKALTRHTTALLAALDTGRGQIATVVEDARRLTEATAGQRGDIEDTMRAMPTLLDSAKKATGELGSLSQDLAPVAANLKRAAPDLNEALLQLPAATTDLRGLLPALDGTLDAAPATLDRVPTFGSDVRALVPGADLMLRDVNPMLAYMKPYGRDLGSMFANFGASMDVKVENGLRPVRLAAVLNSASVRGVPLDLSGVDPLYWDNPYPAPGQAANVEPWRGEYPRVERAPK